MNNSEITENAYAKINLTLEVIKKRADGYHDISSVMQTVDLHDLVKVQNSETLELSMNGGIEASYNLAFKAGQLLQKVTGTKHGAKIFLYKNIPISAGLGGGSSNAAATLRALNKLWELRLTNKELAEIGASLGSDVPFLVYGGTALVMGKGDDVQRLVSPAIDRVLILCPRIHLPFKTRSMFNSISDDLFTKGNLTHKLAARIRARKDCPSSLFFNVFSDVAGSTFSTWSGYKDVFMGMGARDITLSGAGPGMFTVPPTKEIGTAWHLLLSKTKGWQSFLTTRFNPPDRTD